MSYTWKQEGPSVSTSLCMLLRIEWKIILGLLERILHVDTESYPYTDGIFSCVGKTNDSIAVTCDMCTSEALHMCCLSSLEPPLVCACGWELVADVDGGREEWLW